MKTQIFKFQWNCDDCSAEETTESTNPEGVLPANWYLIENSWYHDYNDQFIEVKEKLFCNDCQKSRFFRRLQENQSYGE